MDSAFLCGCLYETMRALHSYPFKTSCLVCDGANINVAEIKSTIGGLKQFKNVCSDSQLTVSFDNPFDSSITCYWIVCPSHQLKNMVSALHSSRLGGTKQFCK